jgi:hypothetical protein
MVVIAELDSLTLGQITREAKVRSRAPRHGSRLYRNGKRVNADETVAD